MTSFTVPANLFNVKDFGAKGDGIADDTLAFKDALSERGRTILVPSGIYNITDTLVFPADTSLIGLGNRLTVIRLTEVDGASGAGKALFETNGEDFMRIESMHLQSTFEASSATDETAISQRGSTVSDRNHIYELLRLTGFSKAGIHISGGWHTNVRSCTFISCGNKERDSGAGIYFEQSGADSGWAGSGHVIQDCYFASYRGVYNDAGWNVTLINCVLEYCDFPLFKSAAGSMMIVQNCWFEKNKNAPELQGAVLVMGGRGFSFKGSAQYRNHAVIMIDGANVVRLSKGEGEEVQKFSDLHLECGKIFTNPLRRLRDIRKRDGFVIEGRDSHWGHEDKPVKRAPIARIRSIHQANFQGSGSAHGEIHFETGRTVEGGEGLETSLSKRMVIHLDGVRIEGDLHVTGNISKSGGSFMVDHPLDPENKSLSHSFVESPDMMNIYNGTATLDEDGVAWVRLPEWFQVLNKDFRYQLTSIGAAAPNLHVAQPIDGGRFQIAGGTPQGVVSWQVTGIRQDTYANERRIIVEQNKNRDSTS